MVEHPTVTLLRKLHSRTGRSRLKWEETAWPNTFQVAFADSAVQISHGGDDSYLRISDAAGDLVEEVSDTDLEKLWTPPLTSYALLHETFVGARRIARGFDRAVHSILDALGEDEPEDEDIPF
jgi:hypothetical protein